MTTKPRTPEAQLLIDVGSFVEWHDGDTVCALQKAETLAAAENRSSDKHLKTHYVAMARVLRALS